MKNYYIGIDIGSISTKGVIIDDNSNILVSKYIWTEANPIKAVKDLLKDLKMGIPKDGQIKGIGTTGSARKLIGLMVDASIVKNEITAHAIGTLHYYPDVKTILEIGGQDSKIIIINNGIVSDYAMNTLCAAGTGAFLTSQAKRLGLSVEELGQMALSSKTPVKIAARCSVFAESDLIHKAQVGYNKEDIVAGLCRSVVINYLNNVGKGKRIEGPIVFQGGVSKNSGVVKYFKEILKQDIIVDENSHLMGAIGIALLAMQNKTSKTYDLNMIDIRFETKGFECQGCSNNCEILKIYRGQKLIDVWGNRCPKGLKEENMNI
ncbi:MAG: acyl-CoA dehydratase activase [Bacilli bacterium]|nr:acyl-CoA dehydratase activase [Bacilli bacterium]